MQIVINTHLIFESASISFATKPQPYQYAPVVTLTILQNVTLQSVQQKTPLPESSIKPYIYINKALHTIFSLAYSLSRLGCQANILTKVWQVPNIPSLILRGEQALIRLITWDSLSYCRTRRHCSRQQERLRIARHQEPPRNSREAQWPHLIKNLLTTGCIKRR